MRSILLIAAMAVACQAAAHANEPSTFELAQASPQAEPAAQLAPATPQTDPAAQPASAAPAAQAAPAPAAAASDAAPPTAKATKPVKKRVAKRHNWEADEAKARNIAAKYGVSW